MKYTILENRSLIELTGADRNSFLQGLITNDIEKLAPADPLYAALLTPQGKFLFDLFLYECASSGNDGAILIDVEASRREDLIKKLSPYKLRADVALTPTDDLKVVALWGEGDLPKGVQPDPRLSEIGARALLTKPEIANLNAEPASFEDYDTHRLALGLPDGSRDLPVDQAILLENGFDEMAAICWDKGCYLGQELTARTKYRGLVRKRLLPVRIEGQAPEFDVDLMVGGQKGNKKAGRMRSSRGDRGLALIRLEHLASAQQNGLTLSTDDNTRLFPEIPDWMILPLPSDES